MATSSDLVNMALTQVGKPYVFGAEADAADPDPRSFDCSELVEWACARVGLEPRMPDYSVTQYTHCRDHGLVRTVEEAAGIAGALLFTHRDEQGQPVEPDQVKPVTAHVAISLGDTRTVEAMGTKWGVLVGSVRNRSFSHGALVPGLAYDTVVPAPVARVTTAASAPTPSTGRPYLQAGTTGEAVTELQTLLLRIGAQAMPAMRPNGHFGDLTDIAVRLFQCHVKAQFDPTMEIDGECGPITWAWIERLLAPSPV